MQHINQWKEKKREEWSKYASQLLIAHPEMTFLEVQPLIFNYLLSQIPSLLTLLEEEIGENLKSGITSIGGRGGGPGPVGRNASGGSGAVGTNGKGGGGNAGESVGAGTSKKYDLSEYQRIRDLLSEVKKLFID